MELGIAGRRALVTGASAGIGEAIARRLASEGADVTIVGRTSAALDAVVESIGHSGGSVMAVIANVASEAGRDVVAAVIGDTVDILVNNVGGGTAKPLLDLTSADWLATLELNLISAVDLTRRVVPGMLERGWGRIVHVGSIAAREPGRQLAAYAASKAALVSYSKSLSATTSNRGVLSNVVLPGLTDSRSTRDQLTRLLQAGHDESSAIGRLMGRRRPAIARMSTVDEVAAGVLFLCSDAASAITGTALAVDGGALVAAW